MRLIETSLFHFKAAALLKKTEGVVTLVVCNPNRAKEDEKKTIETPTVVAGGSTPTALTPTKSSIAGTPSELPVYSLAKK